MNIHKELLDILWKGAVLQVTPIWSTKKGKKKRPNSENHYMISMLYRLVTMTKGKLLSQVVRVWSIIEYTEKKKKKKKKEDS